MLVVSITLKMNLTSGKTPIDKVILGIDPGTNVMGYGVLQITEGKPHLLVMGVLELKKFESHYLRLRRIYERVQGLIDQYHPDDLAIESPFVGINPASLIKLCRAQGVAMAAAVERDVPIFEYAPTKIKISITGNGGSAKEQVKAMLQNILKIADDDMNKRLDASDALAVALCHYYETCRVIPSTKPGGRSTWSSGSAKTSWADFARKNQDRIRK